MYMLFFAHPGHDHNESIVQASSQSSISYGGYLVLAVGLMILFVGVVLLINIHSRSTRKRSSQPRADE